MKEHGYGSIPAIKNANGDSNGNGLDNSVKNRSRRIKWVVSSVMALAVLGYAGFKTFSGDSGEVMDYDLANVDTESPKIVVSPKKGVLLDNTLDSTSLWHKQYMDHMGEDTEHYGPKLDTYNQRFLKKSTHFKGPGHPILVIMGGEGSLDPPMLYQFVNDGLTEEFGAFVLSPEHRYEEWRNQRVSDNEHLCNH